MRKIPRPQAMLLLATLIVSAWAVAAHEPVARARYLGNEGILITACDTKVLFDAIYSDSKGRYVLVPDTMRADLMAGRPPYDGVDALFVSHIHGDHFTPEPTLAYLRAHPEVTLFGSLQVVDALRAVAEPADSQVLTRLVAFDIAPGDAPRAVNVGDIQIDVVALPHAGGARMAEIRNLVFRVTLGEDATVTHLGDAAADDVEFARQQRHWDAEPTHAAFPPYWFFNSEDGRHILEERLKADLVVGIHVPEEAMGHGDPWRERMEADLFTDPGETRVILSVAACRPDD